MTPTGLGSSPVAAAARGRRELAQPGSVPPMAAAGFARDREGSHTRTTHSLTSTPARFASGPSAFPRRTDAGNAGRMPAQSSKTHPSVTTGRRVGTDGFTPLTLVDALYTGPPHRPASARTSRA